MREWIELADVLKQVRLAENNFLGRWALEEAVIRPGLDRVSADITGRSRPSAEVGDEKFGSDYLT